MLMDRVVNVCFVGIIQLVIIYRGHIFTPIICASKLNMIFHENTHVFWLNNLLTFSGYTLLCVLVTVYLYIYWVILINYMYLLYG